MFLWLALSSIVSAQTFEADGVKFVRIPDLESKGYFGYNFVRVQVSNNSGRNRNIRFFMRADYSRELQEVSRRFMIAAGETREETLFFPIVDFSSPGLIIEIDEREYADNSLLRYYRSYRNHHGKKQALVDTRISRKEFDSVFVEPAGAATHLNLEMNQFEGSLNQLYRTWLGYSQFNLLVYYATTIEEMPAAVQQAVFDYVRAGGALLVLGKIALPDDFASNLPLKMENMSLPCFYGGFGKIYLGDENLLDQMLALPSGCFPEITSDSYDQSSLRHSPIIRFREDEIETVSGRWLMLIVYLFAFLIGPVNVFVLHRLGRKIYVFFTVPVASLICCAFIYGYYVVFESSVLIVRDTSLTLLDERYNRAITLAGYGVFSSGTIAEGLKFENETDVCPFNENDYRSADAGKYIILDESQHLAAGWIKPRVARYLHLRMLQTRRERVSLIQGSSQPEILNGLGADIEEIYMRFPDGILWHGGPVRAGNKMILQKLSGNTVTPLKMAADIMASGWISSYDLLINNPEKYLSPGQYIARTSASPFFSQEIDKMADKKSRAVILGIMKVENQ